MATRLTILVAGFNPRKCPFIPSKCPGKEHKPHDSTNFMLFCKARRTYLAKKFPDMVFVFFEFETGRVLQAEGGTEDGKEVNKFSPITCKDNYNECREFRLNPTDRLSITDVYKRVEAMGAPKSKEAGTLYELSIFSHGYFEGPVLVNSFDEGVGTGRGSMDKDGRYKKDFVPPTMEKEDKRAFRAAFASDGYIWLWGCDATGVYHGVFEAMKRTPLFHQKKIDKWQDADNFSLNFPDSKDGRTACDHLHLFLKDKKSFAKDGGKIDVILRRLREYFRDAIADTYAAKIAAAAGVRTYGASPGTWASVIMTGKQNNLMHVRMSPEEILKYKGEDFSNFIAFYEKHLSLKEDPETRGYGTFLP
jgi:hypothetical protein